MISFPSEEESDREEANSTPVGSTKAGVLGSSARHHVTEHPVRRSCKELSVVAGQKRGAISEEEEVDRGRWKMPRLEETTSGRTVTSGSSLQPTGVSVGGGGAVSMREGEEKEMVCVLVRFPDGRRVEKSFPANQQLQVYKYLYFYYQRASTLPRVCISHNYKLCIERAIV